MPDESGNTKNLTPFQFESFSADHAKNKGVVEVFQWSPIAADEQQLGSDDKSPIEDLLPHIVTDAGRVVDELSPDLFRQKAEDVIGGHTAPAPPAVSEQDKLIAEAKRKAEEIIGEAQAEAEIMRESARENGYTIGYEEGLVDGKEKAQTEQETILQQTLQYYLEDIKNAVDGIEQEKDRILDEYLADLRDLSIAVAEKVISISLKSSGQVIEKMIISATDRMKNKQWAKISISKHDADLMLQGDMDIISAMQNISENVKVTVMEAAEPGTAIIEFPDQIIDASVKTQLDNIKELLDIRREDSPEE